MKNQYNDKVKIFTSLVGSLSIFNSNNAEAQTMISRTIDPAQVLTINSNYALDIDNDGDEEFNIIGRTYAYGSSITRFFYFNGNGNNLGVGNPPIAGSNNAQTFLLGGNDKFVDRLDLGDTTTFTSEYNDILNTVMFVTVNGIVNNSYRWTAGTSDKYVGVQFTIGTEVHFGWVKLDIASDYSTITVKAVGYESSPGALSKAGATTSAGLVSNLSAVFVANNNDASDITVSFNKATDESNILGYRVAILPTISAAGVTLREAQLLTADRFAFIPKSGSNISQALPSTLLDANGDAIANNTNYTVFVMTVGDLSTGDALLSTGYNFTTGTTESGKIAANIFSDGSSVFFNDMPRDGQVKVVNSSGATIYSGTLDAGSSVIQLAASSGIYTVQVIMDNLVSTKKINVLK